MDARRERELRRKGSEFGQQDLRDAFAEIDRLRKENGEIDGLKTALRRIRNISRREEATASESTAAGLRIDLGQIAVAVGLALNECPMTEHVDTSEGHT